MAGSVTGHKAELWWAWHQAATMGDWSLSFGTATTLTASIQTVDDYRVSQRPLVFVVPRLQGPAWRWPVEGLQIADGRVTATLGPQE